MDKRPMDEHRETEGGDKTSLWAGVIDEWCYVPVGALRQEGNQKGPRSGIPGLRVKSSGGLAVIVAPFPMTVMRCFESRRLIG